MELEEPCRRRDAEHAAAECMQLKGSRAPWLQALSTPGASRIAGAEVVREVHALRRMDDPWNPP